MNECSYKSFRMIVCHEYRQSGDDICDDWRCQASKDDIDNCIDGMAPIETYGY